MAALTPAEARKAAATLDRVVEERIDLALTPETLRALAAKGVSEAAARAHLRKRAAQALVAHYA